MTTNNNDYIALQQTLNDWVMLSCTPAQSADEKAALRVQLLSQCDLLERHCISVGLDSLALLLQCLNLALLEADSEHINEENLNILAQWGIIAASYLDGALQGDACRELLDSLTILNFLTPPPDYLIDMIVEGLPVQMPVMSNTQSTVEPVIAEPEQFASEESIAESTDNLFTEKAVTEPEQFASEEVIAESTDDLFTEEAIAEPELFASEEATDDLFAESELFGTENLIEAEQHEDLSVLTESAPLNEQQNSDEAIWLAPEEIDLIVQAINEQLLPLSLAIGGESEAQAQIQIALEYQEQWGFISSALEAVNFACLVPLCADVELLLMRLVREPAADDMYLVAQWTMMLANYFQSPQDELAIKDLCSVLEDPAWPSKFSAQQSQQLAQQLQAVNIGYDPRLQIQRKTKAEAADIELQISGDVLPEVLESMLRELPQRTTEFSQVIQKVVRFGNPEAIEVAKRIAHTLKGDGNIVGIRGIAVLTHSLEEILLVLTETPGVPVKDLANVLLESADCLESMSDYVLGQGDAPDNALVVLQQVLDWDTALHSEDKPTAIASPPQQMDEAESASEGSAHEAPEVVASSSGHHDTINVPVSVLNHLLQMTGEAIIYSRQVENRALQLEKRIADIHNDHQGLQRVVMELQQLVEVHGHLTSITQRDNGEQLDALEMEHYNELHTVTNRLVEASTDTLMTGQEIEQQIDALKDLLVSQDQIHLELQEKMLATLTVPVAGLVPRLQRIVRQAARQVDKEIDVKVSGEHTLIDHDILHQLAEPMSHLLRNAVDHGLEANSEREFLGKSERGQISLNFARDGNQIVIKCQDDGRGLDKDAILQRAIQKELVSPQDELTPDDIYRLIFRAGFTTRDQASEISGRGIGMDIVLRSINRMKGQLLIDTHAGQGTTFEIRLPTSQLVANVSLVKTAAGWLAVSLQGLEKLLLINPNELIQQDEQVFVDLDGEQITVRDAETLFGMTAQTHRQQQQNIPALLLNSPEYGRQIVLVEAFGESRTVIVKPLAEYLPSLAGIRGATILGDGTVAPVVDLSEALAVNEGAANWMTALSDQETIRLPMALVVDDSLSVRRAMEQLLQDSGFEVRLARDGLEAVALLKDITPDIMLVDMEMPRMNGLELTAFTRNNQSTANIPVIMITSRTTERHKVLAEEAGVDLVLSKPYTDENLLDAISVQRALKTQKLMNA